MAIKLSDIVGNLDKETLVFAVINSISIGESITSKYGVITRTSDTEFTVDNKSKVELPEVGEDIGDPDQNLRRVFK